MTKMQYFEPLKAKRGDELGNFNKAYRSQPHRGNDWSGAENKPIKAITNGRVKKIFWSDVLGHCLIQSSGDGFYWLYAHLAAKPTLELNALLVGGSTVIGLVGGGKKTPSGSASTGAHLHMAGCPVAAGLNVHLAAYDKLVDVFKHIDSNNKPVAAAAAPKASDPAAS